MVQDSNIAVELTLPRGRCSDRNIADIQDTINWAAVLLFNKKVEAENAIEGAEIQRAAVRALREMCERREDGKSRGYIATADDLKALRDFYDRLAPALLEIIEYRPVTSVSEYLASVLMQRYAQVDDLLDRMKGEIPVYVATEEDIIREAVRAMPHIRCLRVDVLRYEDWYDKKRFDELGLPYPPYLRQDLKDESENPKRGYSAWQKLISTATATGAFTTSMFSKP
jgi:hypothetical protein